jgi:hypothetical protein
VLLEHLSDSPIVQSPLSVILSKAQTVIGALALRRKPVEQNNIWKVRLVFPPFDGLVGGTNANCAAGQDRTVGCGPPTVLGLPMGLPSTRDG